MAWRESWRFDEKEVYFQCPDCHRETSHPIYRILDDLHELVRFEKMRCDRCRGWIEYNWEEVYEALPEAEKLRHSARRDNER